MTSDEGRRLAKYTKKTLMYLFLILASLLSIFPLYWSFISAFNNTQQILGGRMIPSVYLVQNIQNLFEQQDVFTALKNSFATSILQTVVALAVSSIAGYGFEIYHDKAKDSVMSILMLAMMVPSWPCWCRCSRCSRRPGLINSWIGFILPSISTPFLSCTSATARAASRATRWRRRASTA